ncbi:MAG: hypothetical protein U0168_02325 [Nannocystaceae bacterium]
MGTLAKDNEDERDPSETSGYADIMEIAQSLGIEDEDAASAGAAQDDAEDVEPVGPGFGGAAAAALIGDAALEAPAAANTARTGETKTPPPPPPPRAKTEAPAAEAAKPEAPKAEAKPEPKAEAKPEPKAEAKPAPVVEPKPKAETSSPKSAAVSLPPTLPHKETARPAAGAVTMTPSATPPKQQEEQRKGGVLWLVGLGALVLGGVMWVAMRGDKEPVKPTTAAAEVRAATPAPVEEVKPAPEPPKPAPVVAPPVVEPPPVVEEPPVEPPPQTSNVEVTVTQKKKGDKKKAAADGPPEPAGPPEPKEPEKLTPQEIDEKFRAECVLDPNKPGCAELRKRQKDGPDLDAKLADKLSEAQLRKGFSSVKGKAKACGGAAGETVRVKVSIEGNSGDVVSAEALAPHAGQPLGDCVADALKGAHFPRFLSETMGTVYPVSF